MNIFSILIVSLSLFLGAIAGLRVTATFNRDELEKYRRLGPYLERLESRRVPLLIFTVVFLAISGITTATGTLIPSAPSFEAAPGPGGQTVEKATSEGFRKEAEETASVLVDVAEDYFKAAERDFEVMQYQDAATNYEKSIDLLPTMAGYLNLGLSLWHVSNYAESQDAFISGL